MTETGVTVRFLFYSKAKQERNFQARKNDWPCSNCISS